MKYIPSTLQEEKEMLKFIGIKNFDELLKIIPEKFRFKGDYGLSKSLSEIELIDYIKKPIPFDNFKPFPYLKNISLIFIS